MATHDLDLANATGASLRSDLNSALKALGTLLSAASAPSPVGGLGAGNVWLDTTSSPYRLKIHNATGWVEVLNFTTGGSPVVTVAGIGTVVQAYDVDTAKLDVVQGWTRQQRFIAQTVADAVTIDWNLDTAQVGTVTLTATRTMGAPSAGTQKDGGVYVLRVKQNGTGGWNLSWNAVFKFGAAGTPTISSAPNAMDIFTFVSDGTNMHCVGIAQGF